MGVDRVTANPGSGGPAFAVDRNPATSADWPISKVAFGDPDVDYTLASRTNPLPVETNQTGGIVTDESANAPAINTLGTLLKTIPGNPTRKVAFVQNQSVTVVSVVLDDDAGTLTPTIIALGRAPAVGDQGGWWDTDPLLHLGRIRIYGAAGARISSGQI